MIFLFQNKTLKSTINFWPKLKSNRKLILQNMNNFRLKLRKLKNRLDTIVNQNRKNHNKMK